MSEKSDAPQRKRTVFAIPEEAHIELVQIRDHLRLMAQLTKVGGNASTVDPRLRPDSMAWCFSRLAMEVSDIVETSYYSAELANAYEAAHRKRKAKATE